MPVLILMYFLPKHCKHVNPLNILNLQSCIDVEVTNSRTQEGDTVTEWPLKVSAIKAYELLLG